MKVSIRRGVFETNSSSTHSLVITSPENFKKFEKGELVFDYYEEQLIPITEKEEEDIYRYKSLEELGTLDLNFQIDEVSYNGENMVLLSLYGHD